MPRRIPICRRIGTPSNLAALKRHAHSVLRPVFLLLPIIFIAAGPPRCASAQESEQETVEETVQKVPQESASERKPATEEEINLWLEMLGSDKFAHRERAAMALVQEGESVLPKLKQFARSTSDPEIRLRAQELVKQIGRDDLEARIAAFLAGKSNNLDGWSVARQRLGDSGSVRELYVEVVLAHPDVALSLEGTPRDRAIAINASETRVRRASIVEQRFPNRADAVALLFPINFGEVPITADYEILLLRVLRTEAGSMLYKNSTLVGAYQKLVAGWAIRSGMERRNEVLWMLLSHDVPQALPLALDTIQKSDDPHTLAVALQAIARFGSPRHAPEITNLLNDDRIIVDHGFIRGKVSQTRLGDAAIATLALLHDISLEQAGFDGVTQDPKTGFQLQEVGFEISDKNGREEVQKKLFAKITEKRTGTKKQEPIQ